MDLYLYCPYPVLPRPPYGPCGNYLVHVNRRLATFHATSSIGHFHAGLESAPWQSAHFFDVGL